MKKASFVSLLLLVTLLVTAFVPTGAALAEVKGISYIPSIVEPSGVILDRTPTYVFTSVAMATKYEFRVYQYGVEKLRREVPSSACGGGYCDSTPTFTLDYKDYEWKVRSYRSSGGWSDFSELTTFIVSSPSFTENFSNTIANWVRSNNKGALWFKNLTYAYTNGIQDSWANLQRNKDGSKYNDFDVTARMQRVAGMIDGKYPANCLAVRMGQYTNGVYLWWPGYHFCVTNGGKYGIYYRDTDPDLALTIVPWTTNAAINTSGWNVLNVVAEGPDFQFSINGTVVATFSDESKDRGYVGFSMYKNKYTDTQFRADYMYLDVIESMTVVDRAASFAPAKLVPTTVGSFANSD